MPTCRTGSAAFAIGVASNAAAPAMLRSVRRVAISVPCLLRGEAVEQTVAARALQVGLAAPAIRSARRVRRIPRQHRRRGVEALAVVVADHGGAGAALGPVAA